MQIFEKFDSPISVTKYDRFRQYQNYNLKAEIYS